MNWKVTAAVAIVTWMTGCASTKTYLSDRGRDMCDMVTVAVEPTIVNAGVQLGPAVTGLGVVNGPGFGMRSGAIGTYHTEELNLITGGNRCFEPSEFDQQRGKGYDWWYGPPYMKKKETKGEWFNWLQCEVELGLLVNVRVGVNLAEIMDFVLGWTTLDICGDDTDMRSLREGARHTPASTALQSQKLSQGADDSSNNKQEGAQHPAGGDAQ